MPVISNEEFAALHEEYQAAADAEKAAGRRRSAAAEALGEAQCNVFYAVTQEARRRWNHFCTLPAGHDGDHGKWPREATP